MYRHLTGTREYQHQQVSPTRARSTDTQRLPNGLRRTWPEYWQQEADYDIKVKLDDDAQRIDGEETITYKNNSPDNLSYIWVQLDQNMRAKDSDTYKVRTNKVSEDPQLWQMQRLEPWFDGDSKSRALPTGEVKSCLIPSTKR